MELVTGERVVYQADNVDMIIAPGSEGTLGILPNHAALVSLMDAGELRVKKGGTEESIIVFGGFIEVLDNRVIILADSAERAEEIDLERAASARERAEMSLQDRSEQQSIAEADAALRRAALRLKVGERVRRRSTGRQQPQ
jgi:F-type H+-transporting ATPase subunit epsilon